MEPGTPRLDPSNSGQAEVRSTYLLPSHAQRVSQALLELGSHIKECKLSRRYTGPVIFIIDQVRFQLKAEHLEVEQIVANLTDEYRALERIDWTTEESAISKRCGPHYGRYAQKLEDTFDCLEEIIVTLGLKARQDPTPVAHDVANPHSTMANSIMQQLIADDSQWAKFLATLCTVTGSAGGALQLQFARINENLKEIKQLSITTPHPSKSLLERLNTIREGVQIAAVTLGDENGFACECQSSHTAFLRINDYFDASQADYICQDLGSTCSLVFNNTSSLESSQWSWVEFELDTHAEDIQPSVPPVIPPPVIPKNPAPTRGLSSIKSALKLVQKVTPRKSVGWGVRPSSSHSSLELKKAGKVKTQSAHSTESTLTRFSTEPRLDLCNFISSWRSSGSLSGSEVSKVDHSVFNLARYGTKLRMTVDLKASDLAVSWKEAQSIQDKYTNADNSGLSTEHKLELAHRLGYSLLYLYSTPWLQDAWNGDDFYLPQLGDVNAFTDAVLLKRRSHTSSLSEAHYDKDNSNHSQIISLGRFLLELSCGSSWKSIRKALLSRSSPVNASDQDDYIFTTFFSWIEDPTVAPSDKPCYEEGRSYFEAIRNCFLSNLDFTTHKEFETWLWEYVLLPLRFALEDHRKKQTQLFWPPLNGSPKSVEPATTSGTPNSPKLFDDETLQGDPATLKKKHKDADKWFKELENVHDIIEQVSPKRPQSPEDRIRVAILDTGVDVTHDELRSLHRRQQLVYQNFVGAESSIPRDDCGHGTHVTSILHKVAKNVDIYVARVSADGEPESWKSEQVTKAIRWAVQTKKVHIISISFGFPTLDSSLEPLRLAILEAHAADVLIFAATGNEGRGNHIWFPACLDEVISVGSTDGSYNKSDFVPSLGPGKRLCALGEAIDAAWISATDEPHSTMDRRAGTSYATPVAAGVAAMVLDFIWADRAKAKNKERYEYRTLRTKRGMLAVMSHMLLRDGEGGFEYLVPAKLFNEKRAGSWSGERNGVVSLILDTLDAVYVK